ncbi:MAG: TRAP transporter small permease [Alphaproteobacteria bacterium]|nr:TRAP transporter small permease [Alphaproteobacteria bacterium]
MGPVFGALDHVNHFVLRLIGVGLMVITLVVFLQVLVRFVLTAIGINISAPWTEEVARYVLIWCVFLGAGVGCRKAQLISLEFVVRWAPGWTGQAMRYLALLLCAALFLLLINVGYQFVVVIGRTELSPVMQIPKTWVYWAMPAGAALMVVNTVALMAEAIVSRRDIRDIGGIASTD